ncbi:MAG: hypothetical protein Q9201_000439 [Fulgogasparrea decipioides]
MVTVDMQSLPAEIIDKIAGDLDLQSLRNLRLACKLLSCYCGTCFKSFFKSQHTDLTLNSLQQLSQITHHPKLGPAVQELTILATVYDTSELDRTLATKRRREFEQQGVFSVTTVPQATREQLDEARRSREQLFTEMEQQQRMMRDESDVQLLADALRGLGKLTILAVEATVVEGFGGYTPTPSAREWHPIWIRAAQVYRSAMLAIAHSRVAVDSLQIYRASQR